SAAWKLDQFNVRVSSDDLRRTVVGAIRDYENIEQMARIVERKNRVELGGDPARSVIDRNNDGNRGLDVSLPDRPGPVTSKKIEQQRIAEEDVDNKCRAREEDQDRHAVLVRQRLGHGAAWACHLTYRRWR